MIDIIEALVSGKLRVHTLFLTSRFILLKIILKINFINKNKNLLNQQQIEQNRYKVASFNTLTNEEKRK